MKAGYAYEVIPQTYTGDVGIFRSRVLQQLRYYNVKSKLGAGVRCQGPSKPKITPSDSIKAQIAYAQQVGLKTASIWNQQCYTSYVK